MLQVGGDLDFLEEAGRAEQGRQLDVAYDPANPQQLELI